MTTVANLVNREYICINSNFYGQLEKDSILLRKKSAHEESSFRLYSPEAHAFSLKVIDKNGIHLDQMLSA